MTARTRLAVLLAASALALAGCGDDGRDAADPSPTGGSTRHDGDHASDPAGDPSSSGSTDGEPDESAAASPSASTDTVTVPVYFVGETPQGRRLYREFRRVDAADPVGAALTLAASGDALDPDYATVLPAGAFTGATTGEVASVPLPDDSWTRRPPGMSEADALLAVQQLVYTAQGVLQERVPVAFTDAAGNATQIFGIASEDAFTAADPLATLALASVTTPEQGATVSGRFTASGVASSFEATVPWEIRRAGTVVKKGFATAEGWMDKLHPWTTEVDLAGLEPGDYTFVAMTDDPSDGEGGGPTEDSKAITVR